MGPVCKLTMNVIAPCRMCRNALFGDVSTWLLFVRVVLVQHFLLKKFTLGLEFLWNADPSLALFLVSLVLRARDAKLGLGKVWGRIKLFFGVRKGAGNAHGAFFPEPTDRFNKWSASASMGSIYFPARLFL